MVDVVLDTLLDTLKLLPFLFLTYLAMEYVEHKAGDSMKKLILKSGKAGPAVGAVLGVVPQCGFSAAASSLYSGRILNLGTLLAVYLSTSDEMLPLMISHRANIGIIVKVLLLKVLIGLVAGYGLERLFGKRVHMHAIHRDDLQIKRLCEIDQCNCETNNNIAWSALKHTLEIALYILALSFLINLVVHFVGVERLTGTVINMPVIGELIAGVVGLIPNCAASIAITELFLEGAIGIGPLMAGLLVGAGVGLLVLFRVNDDMKENLKILGMLYVTGVVAGIVIHFIPFL